LGGSSAWTLSRWLLCVGYNANMYSSDLRSKACDAGDSDAKGATVKDGFMRTMIACR